MMTDFLAEVVQHLTADRGEHRERMQALDDLVGEGLFVEPDEHDQRALVNAYLNENSRRYCAEGIARFREAVELPTPAILATMVVTVQFEPGYNMEFDESETADLVREALEAGDGIKAAEVGTVELFATRVEYHDGSDDGESGPASIHYDVVGDLDDPVQDRTDILPKLVQAQRSVKQGTPDMFKPETTPVK